MQKWSNKIRGNFPYFPIISLILNLRYNASKMAWWWNMSIECKHPLFFEDISKLGHILRGFRGIKKPHSLQVGKTGRFFITSKARGLKKCYLILSLFFCFCQIFIHKGSHSVIPLFPFLHKMFIIIQYLCIVFQRFWPCQFLSLWLRWQGNF